MIHEVQVLQAEEFACEYYNIPREEFVEKAALRYPMVVEAPLFSIAVRTYDAIQEDMKEIV